MISVEAALDQMLTEGGGGGEPKCTQTFGKSS